LIIISPDTELPALLDITLSGVAGINSSLHLYGQNNDLITSSDNNPAGIGEEIMGIGITKPGSYYVMVTAKGYASSDQPYKIMYDLRKHNVSEEMEPNNNFNSANQFVQNHMKGRISSDGDRDFFLYRSGSGRKDFYRIEVRPPEAVDAKISLYDKNRNLIISLDNSGAGGNEVFPNFCSTEDFFIVISAKHNQFSSNYYTLSVDQLDKPNTMETEPNDTKGKASPVNGGSITGYTSYKKDIDYFLLEYDRRVKIEFVIEGVKDGEIKVSITDPLGYILKSVTVKHNIQKNLTEFVDKKGYIIVESIRENYDNPYRIDLKSGN